LTKEARMSDEYVSVDDAAAELGVSRATLWKWIKLRELETFRVLGDRRTLVRRADVARLREPVPSSVAKKLAA
jgi:excisionase family DNA binding protein